MRMLYGCLLLAIFYCCYQPQSLWAQQSITSNVDVPTNAQRCPGYYLSPQERIGINVAREEGKKISDYAVEQLGMGWYLDYAWHEEPAHPATTAPLGKMVYMPMLRPPRFATAQQNGTLRQALAERVGAAVDANPGATWLLGNEPDNRAQDNYTASDYAIFYHIAYHFLKERDPTATVAMAAITQVSPLRLRYLDQVLVAYQDRYGEPLPVDVWTVHTYILPEVGEPETSELATEAWGIGVPPGLEAYANEGLTFTQDQHDDLNLFAEQLIRFRAWMADRGYRNTPLYLTEYGVLLSPYHGFDDEQVRQFLLGSFAYLQQARDETTGLPADDNRLVQRWAWFSLNYYAFDPSLQNPHGLIGLNGNLFDHSTGEIMAIGEAFATYTQRLHRNTVDLAVTQDTDEPDLIKIVNRGDAVAEGIRLRLWWGKHLLGTVTIETQLLPHCGNQLIVPMRWQVLPLTENWLLRVQVLPVQGQFEYDMADNVAP